MDTLRSAFDSMKQKVSSMMTTDEPSAIEKINHSTIQGGKRMRRTMKRKKKSAKKAKPSRRYKSRKR